MTSHETALPICGVKRLWADCLAGEFHGDTERSAAGWCRL